MGKTPLETLTEELRWVAEKLLGKERAEVLDPALVDMASSVNAVHGQSAPANPIGSTSPKLHISE